VIHKLHEVLNLTRPLLGLDLETTGVDPRTSGIVEVGLEIMIPGKPVKEYRTLVNPLMPIPPAASAIHGITNEMVKDAPTFLQLAANFHSGMRDCDFAGYNAWFDLRQLAEEFKRAAFQWDYERAFVLDGMRLWQVAEGRTLTHAVNRWIRGGATDQEFYDECDVEGQAHNALYDVKMSTRVIAAQLKANPQFPRDPEGLHKLLWPDRFDAEGKLRWVDRELCFTFGEHRNKPIRNVPKGYLIWVSGKDFSDRVKETCRNAMKGIYPEPPAKELDGPEDIS
jgi:DNA polymerase-3 subunit epsilon